MSDTDVWAGRRDSLAKAIGHEVRAARVALGLNMRELAERIGTSQPFVSNIENGRLFPSLRTLSLIAEALDVPANRLLVGSERTEVIGAASGMRERRAFEPASRRLLGGPDRSLEAYRVELQPGESEPRPFAHEGEEYVIVLKGELSVLREGMPPVRLVDGAGIWIDGTLPHRLSAPHDATSGAVALAIVAANLNEEGAHA